MCDIKDVSVIDEFSRRAFPVNLRCADITNLYRYRSLCLISSTGRITKQTGQNLVGEQEARRLPELLSINLSLKSKDVRQN